MLAPTQSNHSKIQPSWHPLNQTILRTSHPGTHSIKPVSESWRPEADLKGWSEGAPPPQEEVTAAAASQQLSPFGQAPGPSRPGTKYPVQGIPHFNRIGRRNNYASLDILNVCIFRFGSSVNYCTKNKKSKEVRRLRWWTSLSVVRY